MLARTERGGHGSDNGVQGSCEYFGEPIAALSASRDGYGDPQCAGEIHRATPKTKKTEEHRKSKHPSNDPQDDEDELGEPKRHLRAECSMFDVSSLGM